MSLTELRTVSMRNARVVLLAGPSGSGKSYIARRTELPVLCLDDFYKDGHDPTLPRAHGLVDWDAPTSWDGTAALNAIVELAHVGTAKIPIYDIAHSRRSDDRTFRLNGSPIFMAEGIFAAEIVERCREAGVLADALAVQRPPAVTFIRRLVRDLREHRKPPRVLITRGLRLWHLDREILRRQVTLGCGPMTARGVWARVRALVAACDARA
jgi:uridine kinase